MQVVALRAAALAPLAAAQSSLYQICGADVVGHDASTYKNANPDSCAFFIPNTGDCTTWTNYNGGTCWLKKDCNQFPVVTPNAGAATFVRREGNDSDFGIVSSQADADMPGFDIGAVPGTPSDCYNACRDNTKCFAYTWTACGEGTCWLKSRASAFVYKARAQSYVVMRPAGPFGACPSV